MHHHWKYWQLKNIEEFVKIYESVRDMFIHENENIFTQDDKGWLDYIIKNRSDGYKVRMLNAADEPIVLNAKVLLDADTQIYILELSQLQSGRIKIYEDDFNFVEELEKLSYSFYKEARIRNIRVLTFIDPKIPKYIKSDAAKITQIVYSIMHNRVSV